MSRDREDGKKLEAYRKKRELGKTPEPFGTGEENRAARATRSGDYVVHLHDARRLHYDVRLEVSGALESFAVPKGPTLDPKERRLAVRTEPHPIEYLDFEGIIPEGSYGAGPMIAWDAGHVHYVGAPAEEQLDHGKLDFTLDGFKLHGQFTLVRRKDDEKNWLLFKKHDAFAVVGSDIIGDKPRSIFSGLDVGELERAASMMLALEARAEALGAPLGEVERGMIPMRATLTKDARALGPGFSFELKLDGVRCIARKNGADVLLESRSGRDVTRAYPEIARAVSKLAPKRLVLDGEIIALDEAGQPSFQRLATRIHLARDADVRRASRLVPILYVVFDLLALGERDLRPLPLSARRELLSGVLRGPGVIRVMEALAGDPSRLLEFCHERKLEGIVAKRENSPYRPGPSRSNDWLKLKCDRDEDFVIVGHTLGEGGRKRLGALDVASYENGVLVCRGKVGSGLDGASIDALLERLEPLRSSGPTAQGPYASAPHGRVHVRPEVVVSVRFSGFTDDGCLRHPVFRGIRDDVAPAECTASPRSGDGEGLVSRLAEETTERTASSRAGERRFVLEKGEKVLFPERGFTKRDLVNYLDAVADVMVPWLDERPVMFVRYPDGIHGKSFYQWNAPQGVPSWVKIRKVKLPGHQGTLELVDVANRETLLVLGNLAAIPIHVLAARFGSLDVCDFLTMDLDPSGGTFADVVTLARSLHDLLDATGLVGFPKTSGQSGLHVFVPLGPSISYETARTLADLFGHLLVQRHPDIATMERTKSRRGPRVYVDTGQTGPARTIVAPYAVRAVPSATVSTPLVWSEVETSLDRRAFDIETVPRRVALRGDPMAAMRLAQPSIRDAMGKLEALVRGRG